jgi:hypothetical protein
MRWFMLLGGGLLALPVAVILYFTQRTARDPQQEGFADGKTPDPLPEGTYRGTVPGYERLAAGWLGKRFNGATARGLNLVRDGDGVREAFPFRTYLTPGLDSPDREVLRVDYDLPGNPFWLRVCADELVQREPGQYLGKSYVRLLPGRPFGMLYFGLQKEPDAPADPAIATV